MIELVELSRIVEKLESGSREKGGSISSGVISIGGTQLSSSGGFKWEKQEFVSEAFYSKMRSGKIQPNDILIVKDGATTGKTCFVDDQFPFNDAVINEHVFRVCINSNVAVPKYVFYFLYSPSGQKQILNDFRGTTVGGISRGFIDLVKIPLPDLETQNKIVAVLDKSKSLLDKRENTISKYEALLRATFLEMFGMQNPQYKLWEDVKVGTLGRYQKKSFRTGPFGSSLKHERFQEEGEVAVLGIDNAVDNTFKWKKRRFLPIKEFNEFKKYQVFPRDVIITIMGTVGRSAVIPENTGLSINTKHLAAISLDESKCNPYYLSYSLHSSPYISFQLKARARGAVMEGFNLTLIKELTIKNAPIEAQNHFETIYRKHLQNIQSLIKSRDNFQALFNVISEIAYKGMLKFNTAVDLEVLLEGDYTFFSQNITQEGIKLLLGRLDKSTTNNNKFHTQSLYNKAVHFVFELLKEGKVKQVFHKHSKEIKLTIA